MLCALYGCLCVGLTSAGVATDEASLLNGGREGASPTALWTIMGFRPDEDDEYITLTKREDFRYVVCEVDAFPARSHSTQLFYTF